MSPALMTATALWLGGWIRGAAASDDLLEALERAAPDAPAVVHLHDRSPSPVPVPELMRAIRVAGADCAWLLLPRPGRMIGWPTEVDGVPRPAVLVGRADAAVGLLCHESSGWHWTSTTREVPGTLTAEMLTARTGARALADAVTASAEQLERLGLERPARAAAALMWQAALARLPRGLDPQVTALLDRVAALHDALDLALADDGAAVTAGEARARGAAIRSVVGDVEDVLAGLVGGLNAPAFVSGRETSAPLRPEAVGRRRPQA